MLYRWLMQVERLSYDDKTRQDFASYRAEGAVYSVLVEDESRAHAMALYVPVHTYNCHKDHCMDYTPGKIMYMYFYSVPVFTHTCRCVSCYLVCMTK